MPKSYSPTAGDGPSWRAFRSPPTESGQQREASIAWRLEATAIRDSPRFVSTVHLLPVRSGTPRELAVGRSGGPSHKVLPLGAITFVLRKRQIEPNARNPTRPLVLVASEAAKTTWPSRYAVKCSPCKSILILCHRPSVSTRPEILGRDGQLHGTWDDQGKSTSDLAQRL